VNILRFLPCPEFCKGEINLAPPVDGAQSKARVKEALAPLPVWMATVHFPSPVPTL
jgi:hypothetical protein